MRTTTHNLECEGHPAGEFDPMGATVYCDGSCRNAEARRKRANLDALERQIEAVGYGSSWQTHTREPLEEERDALAFELASPEEQADMLAAQAEAWGERNYASGYGLGL